MKGGGTHTPLLVLTLPYSVREHCTLYTVQCTVVCGVYVQLYTVFIVHCTVCVSDCMCICTVCVRVSDGGGLTLQGLASYVARTLK